MAGGRFSERDGREIGVSVKAMAEIGGRTLAERALAALRDVPSVGKIVITGPEEIRPIANRFGAQWEMETNTLLGNVQAAAYATKPAPSDYIFLVGADMAFPKASAFDSLLANSPQDTGCSAAVITHEMFEAAYPGSPSAYVPLKEGRFTLGSQFLARAHLKLTPPPVVAAMLGHCKSQLAMARALGPTVVWGLLTGTLTLPRLEARIRS